MDSSSTDRNLIISFDDNSLLAGLFGEHDRHIARMEQTLGASLVPRGNEIAITGEAGAVASAQAALEDLYERLRRGMDVSLADVDAAVRMAEGGLVVPASDAVAADNGNSAAKRSGKKSDGKAAAPAPKRQRTTDEETLIRTQKRIISPRSPVQADYVRALYNSELVFGTGPAGTGKTYLAIAVAVSLLLRNEVERIILTRPAVEAGERLGFLPGGLDDKIDPYMRPMYDALYDTLSGDTVMRRRDTGEIEVAPLAYMRGRTLANAFIILDEAQNTTPMQMKMFLTRMGENSRMAVTGDISQADLPLGHKSGLKDALEILPSMPGVEVITFSHKDVVRHPMVTRVVRAYEARDRDLLTPE